MGKVNLDALIPREDFEAKDNSVEDSSDKSDKIKLSELEEKDNFLYPVLRKPDFQRETNEWTPNKICGLIESFVNQDLIPSVIMWNTKGSFTFVIDGAHRLSALIAWVNDDYGDGNISRKFFGNIPEEQKEIAEKTRKLIHSKIGSYKDYKSILENQTGAEAEKITRARDMSRHSVQLQWVKGDVKKAENSFFKINQEASKINKTELTLLKSREQANGISARAIKNSGFGHKYWHKFSKEKQDEIEKVAKEICELIFVPPYKKPVNTLELPLAGKINSAQTLPLILNFVNIVNEFQESMDEDGKVKIEKDENGEKTLKYLNQCKDMAQKINSKHTTSLGLHPAIYFYSKEGNYRTASFYSVIALLVEFNKNIPLQKKFIDVRGDFEKFILDNDKEIYDLSRKYREGIKGYTHIRDYYIDVINKLSNEESKEILMKDLNEKIKKSKSKNFSTNTKSKIFIDEAIEKSIRCKLCNGWIDSKSITIDHIQRKREGGSGTEDNGQISHPYCNTQIKN